MSYYFIAQIQIKDKVEYQKYTDGSDAVFKKYKGEYLSVENDPDIVEGVWNYTRTVLIKFENKKDFNKWYHSQEYQEILKHRLKAAHCDSILIKDMQ